MKARKQQKREEAEARQAIRNTYSPFDQIKRLNNKFGLNEGAKRERARLLKLIEAEKPNKKGSKR
jgi:hypothetical protein